MTDNSPSSLPEGASPELIGPDRGQAAVAIHLVTKAGLEAWLMDRAPAQRVVQAAAQKFKGEPGDQAICGDGDGWLVVAGAGDTLDTWSLARLAETLPAGQYRLVGAALDPARALLGWALGQYRFDRYRGDNGSEGSRVLLTQQVKAIAPALAEAAAVMLVRDLVNTPAEDMGPSELEQIAEQLAKVHRARVRITKGEALEREFPMVHMVGRAAGRAHAPRMIELEWGDPAHPRLAIVGKGVCFDSGGLDIKPSAGMLLMKKDMGGAAHALALARLVMDAALPVRLHLLIPAVENAIAGNAFRPGDVLRSRAGLSVEIGNTDAEGRLILADALARAGEEEPDLLLDFATLTGAARAALGPDLPALMTRRDETAEALLAAGHRDRRPELAPAAARRLSRMAEIRHRRSQQRPRQRLCRGQRRGIVPRPLRACRDRLGPFRHLCLAPHRQAGAATRRRCAGIARGLGNAAGALSGQAAAWIA